MSSFRIWDKESLKDTVSVFDDNPYSKFVVGKNLNVKCLGSYSSKGIRVYLGNITYFVKTHKNKILIKGIIYVVTHEVLHGEIDKEIRNIPLTQVHKYFRFYDEIEETIIDKMMSKEG